MNVVIGLLVAAIVGVLGFLIYQDTVVYPKLCYSAEGHMLEVRGNTICVDDQGRVIHIDVWNRHVVRPR